MEQQGKVCAKCGEWKSLEEYNRNKKFKDGRRYECRECQKEYAKQWRENNPEYRKQHYQNNKEHYKEQHKQWCEQNKEHRKEKNKQWRENNSEYSKQWYEQNKEHQKEYRKQWRENNKEYIKEQKKQYREEIKNDNVVQLTEILKQVNPILGDLNIKAYGSVYKITNIKTGRCYIGQTINPLSRRYTTNIIKGWIEERLEKDNQRFIDELKNEKDFIVEEAIAVGVCRYHLDKLEAYYIEQYDSCNNGYNNNYGNHNTDDGLEEFNKILEDNGLKFVDGKIIII